MEKELAKRTENILINGAQPGFKFTTLLDTSRKVEESLLNIFATILNDKNNKYSIIPSISQQQMVLRYHCLQAVEIPKM